MVTKVTALLVVACLSSIAHAQRLTPIQALKNHALAACIAKGLGPSEAANKASAAAREYMEHGSLPIETYTKSENLGEEFLKRDYKNIYGDDLVFVKCIEFYNSKELDRLAKASRSKH